MLEVAMCTGRLGLMKHRIDATEYNSSTSSCNNSITCKLSSSFTSASRCVPLAIRSLQAGRQAGAGLDGCMTGAAVLSGALHRMGSGVDDGVRGGLDHRFIIDWMSWYSGTTSCEGVWISSLQLPW
jgi:hypothetical protein